jgi:hypothetical protein
MHWAMPARGLCAECMVGLERVLRLRSYWQTEPNTDYNHNTVMRRQAMRTDFQIPGMRSTH